MLEVIFVKEEWLDILNYEGLYQISNKGRVRSVDRICIRKTKIGQTTVSLILNG